MTACDHGPGGLKALEMHVCGVFADYLPACQHVPTLANTGSAGFLASLFRVIVPGSCNLACHVRPCYRQAGHAGISQSKSQPKHGSNISPG